MKVIDIEGIDGSGKTTILKILEQSLKQRNIRVISTREVGNPHIPCCEKLRKIILDPAYEMSGTAMELVFSAMRIENQRWLKNISESYDVILSDRGWLSHLAYTDNNISPEFTKQLYIDFLSTKTQLPDIIIYLNADPEIASQRRLNRGLAADAIEIKGLEFQKLVHQSFTKYIEQYQRQISIYAIDANKDLDNVVSQLQPIIDKIIDGVTNE